MGVKKKYESKGFKIGEGKADTGRRQICIYLSRDAENFIDDFIYQTKKKEGLNITMSSLVRLSLRVFRDLPRAEQIELLKESLT